MTRTGLTMLALLIGTAANAQSGLDGVLSRLESQGFGRFEIDQERDRITIEAHRGREERELVYDARTGDLVRDTVERNDGPDRPSREPAGNLGGGVGPSAVLERAGLGGVVERLRGEGFRAIETEQENGRITVEARRGREERELVYDARTGDLVRDTVELDDDDDRRDRDRADRRSDDRRDGRSDGKAGRDDRGGRDQGRDNDRDHDRDRGRDRDDDDHDDDDDDRDDD